eukprot:SAG31_NODE_2518_length_5574_cov_9.105205_7_plen_50_part_00
MLCFRTRRFQRYPTALEWSKKFFGRGGAQIFFPTTQVRSGIIGMASSNQ